LRRLFLAVGVIAVIALLAWQLSRLLSNSSILPPDDFVEYWAAGGLNAAGENPYDPERLLPLERQAGRDTDEAVMMWNPPWTLTLVMPFGTLPARLSQLFWLILNLAVILFCADWTWRFYGGPKEQRWLAWSLALAFLPTIFVLQSGQIGPLLLLGLVGFLHFHERKLDWLAGAALVLVAIKPHLVYLLWIALLVRSVDRWRWSILGGGMAAGLIALLIPSACNPSVWMQYRDALAHHPPEQWISPTPGAFLRLLFGAEHFWLQFVPTIAGLAWFALYWLKHRRTWDWPEHLPALMLVSFATASYGAWPFDLVVLLLPVIQAAVWVVSARNPLMTRIALAAYLSINGLALGLNLLRFESLWFVWMTPALLACYLLLSGLRSRCVQSAASESLSSSKASLVGESVVHA
jgi:hypothetical protein